MLRVEGTSVEDAFARANHLMLANRWGDGLPLWPPTRERVNWILGGAAQPRGRKLGTFPPRGGVTTIESCAIALAMAGGRPEYLPVLAAAVEAFLDPQSGSEALQAASGSAFPGGDRQRADRRRDPAQCRLRLPWPRSAATGGRQHRPRAAAPAAKPGRRAARRRHHGQLRRPALHQRGLRRGRGEPARGLGAARHRAPRLRAGHQLDLPRLRQRRDQHPAAGRQEGDAGGGRASGHAPHGRLHARAQHGRPRRLRARHPGHPDDPRRGGPDHGRPRLDQGLDARVPLGALADSRRAPAPRRAASVDRDRREQGGTRQRSPSTRGRSPPAPTTSSSSWPAAGTRPTATGCRATAPASSAASSSSPRPSSAWSTRPSAISELDRYPRGLIPTPSTRARGRLMGERRTPGARAVSSSRTAPRRSPRSASAGSSRRPCRSPGPPGGTGDNPRGAAAGAAPW